MNKIIFLMFIVLGSFAQNPPHIAFVVGDEEYRSEESMPMLAEILHRELGAKISMCYSISNEGFIDPNRLDYIDNLEVLKEADLMVLFTRFRALPKEQVELITQFAESGKPMVGFRTSTHAFLYKDSPEMAHLNNEWPTHVWGQQWITHHGHFEDGNAPLTEVSILDSKSKILRGVQSFQAYSWLYHVDGGDWKLSGQPNLLLQGKSLRSKHEMDGKLDKFPLNNPVAWTKSYTSSTGKEAPVFFTTLGHPFDFKNENMRRLAVQGIFWALGMENKIPRKGINVDFVSPYNPNNSGFGNKFKSGILPKAIP